MPPTEKNTKDYQGISSQKKKSDSSSSDFSSLKRPGNGPAQSPSGAGIFQKKDQNEQALDFFEPKEKTLSPDTTAEKESKTRKIEEIRNPLTYSEQLKQLKEEKAELKDKALLGKDNWLIRNGHSLSFAGLFLFTLWLYFRPYELLGLTSLKSAALYIAIATLIIYIPTQFTVEGNITARPPELIFMALLVVFAIISIPIGRGPGQSWEVFTDIFIKVALMFVVMINVLRTEFRLRAMIWLSLGIGAYLSFNAFDLYMKGVFKTEGYRVSVDVGGMFGNPNELATHFVMFIPVVIALAISSKKIAMKIVFITILILFVLGILVTFSRGAFLGLIICAFVMAWKIGRNNKVRVMILSAIGSAIFLAAAPNGYGLRVISIIIPGLDPAGSADQRRELLIRSIWVTIRNPQGVGMGMFRIMNDYGLETHNAYTQVSAELGVLALIIYLCLLISPIRRLGAIERDLFKKGQFDWIYYLSIGLQASIVAFMVASFFGSFAFNWFVYYPIAYAVALRRIYLNSLENSDPQIAANEFGFYSNLTHSAPLK